MNRMVLTLILTALSVLSGFAQSNGEYRMSVVDSMLQVAINSDPATMERMENEGYDFYLKKIDAVYDQLKSEFLATQVLGFFQYPGCHDMTKMVQPYLDRITVDSLKQKVEAALAKHKQDYGHVFPGQPAPDFTFKNEKGKLFHLSDLRGKLLFVDIWGTWCVPCIEEIPYLNKLQEKYKKNKNVHIMSIACDKESARPKWLAFLKKHKEMNWAQYQVTTEGNKILDDVYFVYGIPRFMIIDKDGIIIDSEAHRPSFADFDTYFEKIVNSH